MNDQLHTSADLPRYSLDRRLIGPQIQSRRSAEGRKSRHPCADIQRYNGFRETSEMSERSSAAVLKCFIYHLSPDVSKRSGMTAKINGVFDCCLTLHVAGNEVWC